MDKTEVRKRAKSLGLKTAEKKDSQGICFIHEGTVADWIKGKVGVTPGNIIDTNGKVVGQHEGIVYYTVGQRKRIGGGYDKPMFVVSINSDKNEVVIGGIEDLYRKELIISDVHWTNKPKLPLKCTAKIRYNMEDQACLVKLQATNSKSQINKNSKLKNQNYVVSFSEPQRAITPGQSVVFYQNDQILGGGIIVG
jgi:tRNA-specific 2-thiouridylase